MITKLSAKHKDEVITYLKQESTFNIFMIGDIEAFGMETDFQKIYGEYDAFGTLISVLLIYQTNVCYYTHDLHFNEAYIDILKQYPFQFISGKKSLVELFLPYYPEMTQKEMIFAELPHGTLEEYEKPSYIIEAKTEQDFSKLYHLLAVIDEFSVDQKSEAKFIEDQMLWTDKKTTYYIKQDNKAIATATATAETDINAMVVAVATHPSYRNKGYATEVMKALLDKYTRIKEKDLCLFYDNPSAGKIYKRLGFKPIGKWLMLSKDSNS